MFFEFVAINTILILKCSKFIDLGNCFTILEFGGEVFFNIWSQWTIITVWFMFVQQIL